MADIYDTYALDSGPSTNIRVVQLDDSFLAQDHAALISFSPKVVSLDEAPHFTALSYVRGDEASSKTILLDGQPLTIRENLWTILAERQSRAHGKRAPGKRKAAKRLMWIDALCIAQSRVRERNHQITLMGQIYAKAQGLLVWLDSGVGSCAQAIRDLSVLPECWSACPAEDRVAFANNLAHICASEYWNRLWVRIPTPLML